MAELTLALLGAFEARRRRGVALTLSKKTHALLAYLALAPGHACPRGELATLLWGDTGEAQARQSLRQAVKRLRTALGPRSEALRIDGDVVALDPKSVEVDTITFERLIADGDLAALEGAVALYRGELLAGLDLDEKPFEEWLVGQRERLRELALVAAGRLLASRAAEGAVDEAVRAASRVLAIDPLHEAAHRALMRFHAGQGRRSAALRQYQTCVDALQRELGVEPEAETKQLYQAIVRERVAPPIARPTSSREMATKPAPFVGRDGERARLGELLNEAVRSRGGQAAILGEAGIGKTRLVSWMVDTAVAAGARALVGRSYAYEQILPFGPWSDALRSGVTDDPDLLSGLDERWQAELARLLPELRVPGATPPLVDSDPVHLFESVVQLVTHLADARPLLVVLEDVHWADEISLRLLAFVSRRLRARRLLIVVTAREEEVSENLPLRDLLRDLGRDGQLITLALTPLSKPEIDALVRAVAHLGNAVAVEHLVAQVWATSDGHPFMAVETVRAIEQGTATNASIEHGRAPDAALPRGIEALIAARLERLSRRAADAAGVAAVIGRPFEFPLLAAAAALDDDAAGDVIEELVRRYVLHEVDGRLDFRHVRIRDVALGQVTSARRRVHHRRIADALDRLHGRERDDHAFAIAAHYRACGDWTAAATHGRAAGLAALHKSAHAEAIVEFQRALDAVGRLGGTADAVAREIDIRLDLHHAYRYTGDAGAAREQLDRALAHARGIGDDARVQRTLVQLAANAVYRMDEVAAVAFCEQALALPGRAADVAIRARVNYLLGTAYVGLGRLREAVAALTANVDALAGPLRAERFGSATVPYVTSLGWLALAHADRGEFDAALMRGREAVTIARELGAPNNLIVATITMGGVLHRRGDSAEAVPFFEEALALCNAYGIPVWRTVAVAALGSALAASRRAAIARRHLADAAAAINTTGSPGWHSSSGARVLEGLVYAGSLTTAGRYAKAAIATAEQRGSLGNTPTFLRVLAETAASRHGGHGEAERFCREAIARAEAMEMRPACARAHLVLGRVYRAAGRRAEAERHLRIAVREFRAMGMASCRAEAEAAMPPRKVRRRKK